MKQTEAIKKLRKVLGKGFAYRLDDSALLSDERAPVKAALDNAVQVVGTAKAAKDAKRQELLSDPEYVRLCAEHVAATKARDAHLSKYYARRITVGTANGLFFHIKAKGDNWQDVVNQVTQP